MFVTPAFAQAAGAGDTNSMLMSLLPFALIFVIMYFLILRPQQRKVREHADLVKNIRRGDTVITSGRQSDQGRRRRPDRVRDFRRRARAADAADAHGRPHQGRTRAR